jgi:beta-phosphoglucomutase
MHEMPEALVFDYDGVLADTEVLHWKSWVAVLSRYGIPLTWQEYCRIGRGIGDAQTCQIIRKREPTRDFAELSRENVERKRMVREWSLAEIPIPEATIQLLATLSAYRVGLVTSSERAQVEPVLRAAGIYEQFNAIVFGEDVTVQKPAPDPYLLIAQKLGVQTGIAFEDSEAGVESARAAGFKVIRIEQPKELAKVVTQVLPGQGGPVASVQK